MKNVLISMPLILLPFFVREMAAETKNFPNEIIGYYWAPKKDAKIQIYLRDQEYFGKFVWLANPGKDFKNPDKALQNKDVLGLELLTGFSYDDGTYSGGEIYDPESGKTYSCKMTLDGTRLKVRGYVGISLFGRTEYFERIK
ncbi:MAG: DUF2147 domain-containing protein [Bacteroidota bacterium]